jgi:hypothetical protein
MKYVDRLTPLVWVLVPLGLAVDRTYHDKKWLALMWGVVAGLAIANLAVEWWRR